jgi:CRISPR-associated protein Csx17
MSEQEPIDWSKTTFDGSRREQLRRLRALSLRERLEALDRLTAHAERTRQAASRTVGQQVHEPQSSYSSGRGRNEIVLHGCTPTPLASYLKALAVLRLVAEQAGDPDATGFWRNDVFVLRTTLDRDALLEFFLDRYQPTPLVAPWNGGSGFYYQEGKLNQKDPVTQKKIKTGRRDQPTEATRALEALEASTVPRFTLYREVISFSRSVVQRFGLVEAPKDDLKNEFIACCRSVIPEIALKWIDAAIVLADRKPDFPPLLGTGGNDGNLDFTNNFIQRLIEVFDTATGKAQPQARELLCTALFGSPSAALMDRSIGQFSPGSAGGPNASAGFEGEARINPWDFILMLEGAVLFAASAVRRLESGESAALSAPFTVNSRLGTSGITSITDDFKKKGEKKPPSKGEIWMPLWERPFTATELSALFTEGRAALGRRTVQDGLDFARAVARLGIDRGIAGFLRYGFLRRSGDAHLATPLARIAVRRNPQADLIDDLDRNGWLSRVQRLARDDNAPQALRAQAWQLDAALFALTQRQDRLTVQRVLRLIGRIEAQAGRSPKLMEQTRPVPALSWPWWQQSDDGSVEFRIAAALAGLSLTANIEGERRRLGLRPHLAPLSLDGQAWNKDSRLVCWSEGPLERNLAQLLHRRRLEAIRLGAEGEVLRSTTGATLEDIESFLALATDDDRIAELAHGLACINREADMLDAPRSPAHVAMPSPYMLLKPFFTSEAMLRGLDWLPPGKSLRLPAELAARLAADDVAAAVRLAWQRLRGIGKKLPGRTPPEPPRRGDGPRLLAALAIPLSFGEMRRVLNQLDLGSEDEPESDVETA